MRRAIWPSTCVAVATMACFGLAEAEPFVCPDSPIAFQTAILSTSSGCAVTQYTRNETTLKNRFSLVRKTICTSTSLTLAQNYGVNAVATIDGFIANSLETGFVFLLTHGVVNSGEPILEYVTTASTYGAAEARRLAYLERSDNPFYDNELTRVGLVYEGNGSFLTGFGFGMTRTGLRQRYAGAMVPNGIFFSASCYGFNMANDMNPYGAYLGYDYSVSNLQACAQFDLFLGRLAGKDRWIGPRVSDAVRGLTDLRYNGSAARSGAPPGSSVIWSGYPDVGDIVLSCSLGGFNTDAQLATFGAWGDTAYCVTTSEIGSRAIGLLAINGDLNAPSSVDTVEWMVPHGGADINAGYKIGSIGSASYFQWIEVDSLDRVRLTPPFARGGAPTGALASLLSDGVQQIAAPDTAITFALNPGSTEASSAEAATGCVECADIVVYSSNSEMATAVAQQIATDLRGAKIRKIVGSDNTSNALKSAMSTVIAANQTYNTTICPAATQQCRPYPVAPGPELYIVGESGWPAIVAPATYVPAYGLGCSGCRSDLDLYDLDNDGLPDGPVSRVPSVSTAEALAASEVAAEYNADLYVDHRRRVLFLEGDDLAGAAYEPHVRATFDSAGASYATIGFSAMAPLRSSNSLGATVAVRNNAFESMAEGGVSEIFGVGGITSTGIAPGYFIECSQLYGRLPKQQRAIGWFPACKMHATFDADNAASCYQMPILQQLMFESRFGLRLPATVSHMNNGYDDSHLRFAEYLLAARRWAARSPDPVVYYPNQRAFHGRSVARITFVAVRAAAAENPNLRTFVRGVSTWGSYVQVPYAPYNNVTLAEPTAWLGGLRADAMLHGQLQMPSNGQPGFHWYEWHDTADNSQYPPGQWIDRGIGYASHQYLASGPHRLRVEFGPYRAEVTSGGVAEGGGCPRVDILRGADWVFENTVLGRSLTGQSRLDSYRLRSADPHDTLITLRIHEDEQEVTSLEQLRLIAVDRTPGSTVYAIGDRVVVGVREGASRVESTLRGDVTTAMLAGGSGYRASMGETLLVTFPEMVATDTRVVTMASTAEFEGDPLLIDDGGGKGMGLSQFAATSASGASADAQVLESTGCSIEAEVSPTLWSSVGEHYPRERAGDAIYTGVPRGRVRLVMREARTLRFLGRLLPSRDSLRAVKLIPLVAQHSRLGDVLAEVIEAGNVSTHLQEKDTLTVKFANPPMARGMEREFFLLSRGVYTSNLPARPVELGLPTKLSLGNPQPNPSRSMVRFGIEVPAKANIGVYIYDAQGRRVKVLADGEMLPGRHLLEWDRRDDSGSRVNAGIYLCQMVSGHFAERRKVVVVR